MLYIIYYEFSNRLKLKFSHKCKPMSSIWWWSNQGAKNESKFSHLHPDNKITSLFTMAYNLVYPAAVILCNVNVHCFWRVWKKGMPLKLSRFQCETMLTGTKILCKKQKII